MNTYGEVNVQIQVFLTSALAGNKWSASLPSRFNGESVPDTYWTGSWVGPRVGLDDMKQKAKLSL
jgi:hypothetical protein